MTANLNIAVMGAGAVGCYYGGMLARAGHSVVLIGRQAHAEAIARAGLHLQTALFDGHVPLKASTDARAVEGADVVLLCVKSADTESAGAQIRPFLAPCARVLTLQNGVDNANRLRTVLTRHTVAAAVVYVATEMAGPGHVKHHGRGELVLEPTAGEDVRQALVAAGVPVTWSDNVRGALWAKLILNCAYNAVSAITQLPYGKTAISEGVPQLMKAVVGECLAVALADGVSLPGGVPAVDAALAQILATMPSQFSSTAQDLARGKPTEIDHLNGLIVRRGQALGVATPANQVLWALVKLLEGKQAAR